MEGLLVDVPWWIPVDPRRDPFIALAGNLRCTCRFALALIDFAIGPLAAPFGLFMWLATQRIEHSREIHINVHALAAYPTVQFKNNQNTNRILIKPNVF